MVIPQCQFCLPKIRQEMRSYMSLSLHSAFISWILEPSPKGLIASRVFMSNPPCILGPTYLFICHLLRIVIKFWNVLLSIFYPIFFHEKLCQFCSCLFFSVFCLALKKHFFESAISVWFPHHLTVKNETFFWLDSQRAQAVAVLLGGISWASENVSSWHDLNFLRSCSLSKY